LGSKEAKKEQVLILGIGGWLHDGAAAILSDGSYIAAAEEEKLLRQRHPGGYPGRAVEACLEIAGAQQEDVQVVALARPLATGRDAFFHLHLKALFPRARMIIVDHHTAHAASAFYCSPFEESRVLTLDRHGDIRCGALWEGKENRLEVVEELYSPDSPAALYSRTTELLGFQPESEEHKVQWLSVTGQPRFRQLFLDIIGLDENGLPHLDHGYFDSARTTQGGFGERFYSELRVKPGEPLDENLRADLAASVQAAVEQAALAMGGEGDKLCLGGGLAYNALLVQAFEDSGRFSSVWVQPVAGNAGTALGSALYVWHKVLLNRERTALDHLFLGPEYSSGTIKQVLENCKLRFRILLTQDKLADSAVALLTDNKIVAWFQGRMEFGPRALGNRSILASPLNPYSTQNLNEYIKHRESFRKFAASVPEEVASQYFEVPANVRFLATVSRVKPEYRETFKAALLDGDRLRVHVVSKDDNRLYWELLQAIGKASGLPVLYNTSFNLFGEPLVCDPRAALRSFYSSGVDAMFLGHFLLEK
jgi:carbamoyltransferase